MKRVVKIALIVAGAVAIVGGITTAVLFVKNMKDDYEIELASKDGIISSLQSEIDNIGPITTGYKLAYDVKSGTIIETDDLVPIDMPESYAYVKTDEEIGKKGQGTGFITDINDVVGKRYKTDLKEGTMLSAALVYPNDLTGDLRYLDIYLDELPIGIQEGKYIDVRFQFTLGQDFIALTHKEVVMVNANIVTLVVSQADIYTVKSMELDRAYYPSSKIYGVEYIDGGIQASSDTYYPLRIETLTSMVQDPNLGDDFNIEPYQHVDRDLLEEQLISKIDAESSELYGQLIDIISENKDEISAQYQRGVEYYNSLQDGTGSASGSSTYVPNEIERVYN